MRESGRAQAAGRAAARDLFEQVRERYFRIPPGVRRVLYVVVLVATMGVGAALDARVVLCLHDELLVLAPAEHGDAVARLVDECLAEAAHRWHPAGGVRFIADTSVIDRWSDAKG